MPSPLTHPSSFSHRKCHRGPPEFWTLGAFEGNKSVDLIMCDSSKDFDVISRTTLQGKLKHYGILRTALKIFEVSLSRWMQVVSLVLSYTVRNYIMCHPESLAILAYLHQSIRLALISKYSGNFVYGNQTNRQLLGWLGLHPLVNLFSV